MAKLQSDTAHVQVAFYDRRRMDHRVIKVDRRVWKQVSTYQWFLLGGNGDGKEYCVCGDIPRHPTYLHRMAWRIQHNGADIPDGMCIDHINGDETDNRGVNLRCVTYSDNSMNKAKGVYKRGPCGSSFKGVWKKEHKRKSGEIVTAWVGEVAVKGHKRRRKTFSEKDGGELAAARWYNDQVTALCPQGVPHLNNV